MLFFFTGEDEPKVERMSPVLPLSPWHAWMDGRAGGWIDRRPVHMVVVKVGDGICVVSGDR